MSHTDAVADVLTRIRNASRAGLPTVVSPYSTLRERLVKMLLEEGYLAGVEAMTTGQRKVLVVTLKYVAGGGRAIIGLERVSKPGRRVYVGYNDVKPLRSGLGVSILSTPKGLLTDTGAKKLKVGGELLCRVW